MQGFFHIVPQKVFDALSWYFQKAKNSPVAGGVFTVRTDSVVNIWTRCRVGKRWLYNPHSASGTKARKHLYVALR